MVSCDTQKIACCFAALILTLGEISLAVDATPARDNRRLKIVRDTTLKGFDVVKDRVCQILLAMKDLKDEGAPFQTSFEVDGSKFKFMPPNISAAEKAELDDDSKDAAELLTRRKDSLAMLLAFPQSELLVRLGTPLASAIWRLNWEIPEIQKVNVAYIGKISSLTGHSLKERDIKFQLTIDKSTSQPGSSIAKIEIFATDEKQMKKVVEGISKAVAYEASRIQRVQEEAWENRHNRDQSVILPSSTPKVHVDLEKLRKNVYRITISNIDLSTDGGPHLLTDLLYQLI